MNTAEHVVNALLDGRVKDWVSDRWQDLRVATGIGHDEFGLGKAEKGFKPRFDAHIGSDYRPLPKNRKGPPKREKVWGLD